MDRSIYERYGMSYGGTSSHEPSHGRCTSVIMLLSIEALIGLMYAGMCASILFGKMNRLQSYAPVLFSHTLCINFSDPQMHNDKSSLGNLDDMLMTQKENEIAITDEKGCIGKNLEVDHELQSTHFKSKWMKSLPLMTLNSSNKGEKKKLQTQSSRIDPQNSLMDITYNFTTSQPCPCLSFQIINQVCEALHRIILIRKSSMDIFQSKILSVNLISLQMDREVKYLMLVSK